MRDSSLAWPPEGATAPSDERLDPADSPLQLALHCEKKFHEDTLSLLEAQLAEQSALQQEPSGKACVHGPGVLDLRMASLDEPTAAAGAAKLNDDAGTAAANVGTAAVGSLNGSQVFATVAEPTGCPNTSRGNEGSKSSQEAADANVGASAANAAP